MFARGSRYRNLPQTPHLTAKGERVLSANLRLIPPTPGRFLHTVRDRERPDLLAFKYYSDPRRWWLIADANPEHPFPVDLLDTRPMVDEELGLVHPGYAQRVQNLLLALSALGTARPGQTDLFSGMVVVQYAGAATRLQILNQITLAGFHLLSTFAWPKGTDMVEAFTFEDRQVKADWNKLVARLTGFPGMLRADSIIAGETLRLTYNTAVLSRETILRQVEGLGYAIVPQLSRRFGRTGAQIIVPPDRAA